MTSAVDAAAAVRAYNEGVRAIQEGDSDAAAASWKRAVTLDPGMTPALRNLVVYHEERDQTSEVIRAYDAILSFDPFDTESLIRQASAHRRAGNLGAAIENYERAIGIYPYFRFWYEELATLFDQSDRPDDGELWRQRARDLDSDAAEMAFEDAVRQQREGNAELAKTIFEAVLEEQPANLEARVRLATLLVGAGDLDAAMEHLGVAFELTDAAPALVLFHRARLHAAAGRTQEAVIDLEMALDAEPDYGRARRMLESLESAGGGTEEPEAPVEEPEAPVEEPEASVEEPEASVEAVEPSVEEPEPGPAAVQADDVAPPGDDVGYRDEATSGAPVAIPMHGVSAVGAESESSPANDELALDATAPSIPYPSAESSREDVPSFEFTVEPGPEFDDAPGSVPPTAEPGHEAAGPNFPAQGSDDFDVAPSSSDLSSAAGRQRRDTSQMAGPILPAPPSDASWLEQVRFVIENATRLESRTGQSGRVAILLEADARLIAVTNGVLQLVSDPGLGLFRTGHSRVFMIEGESHAGAGMHGVRAEGWFGIDYFEPDYSAWGTSSSGLPIDRQLESAQLAVGSDGFNLIIAITTGAVRPDQGGTASYLRHVPTYQVAIVTLPGGSNELAQRVEGHVPNVVVVTAASRG